MKYLEESTLARMNHVLSYCEVGDRIIQGSLESFSCKRAGQDKKLAKQLQLFYQNEVAADLMLNGSTTHPLTMSSRSPPNTTLLEKTTTLPADKEPIVVLASEENDIGSLQDATTRKLMINLISTMNASFPDYEFSGCRPEQFQKMGPLGKIMHRINTQLAEMVEIHTNGFLEELWTAIEHVIHLQDCQVYSYLPNMESDDPFTDGCLWSFNYFFYNPKMKKVLYFTCMSKSQLYDYHCHDGMRNTICTINGHVHLQEDQDSSEDCEYSNRILMNDRDREQAQEEDDEEDDDDILSLEDGMDWEDE